MSARVLICSVAMLGLLADAQTHAQGLIWTLPDDGAWVRYEGTYSQLVRRPDAAEGDLRLEWTRHLTIKSVGTVEEEYQGKAQPCRWLEFKVTTAEASALLDAGPGPGGERIYKILVPESAVMGRIHDDAGILVSFLPVVRGYRKLGDEPPQPIESGVFQLYPVVSFLRHYRQVEADAQRPEPVDLPLGTVAAVPHKGSMTVESTETRSTNEATLWRSEEVPFGLAKWTVRDVRAEKFPTEPRDAFRETVEVSVEMSAHEVGSGAVSEIDAP
jgi:hypothetical protein